MCLGLATGYREPTENKERTYADLKFTHFPENKIDTELTSEDFLKALEYVKEYEKAIKEEQAFLNNGDEWHIKALQVLEVVEQALEKQIPEKPVIKTHKYKGSDDDFVNKYHCPVCDALIINEDTNGFYAGRKQKHCDCGQALDWSDKDEDT